MGWRPSFSPGSMLAQRSATQRYLRTSDDSDAGFQRRPARAPPKPAHRALRDRGASRRRVANSTSPGSVGGQPPPSPPPAPAATPSGLATPTSSAVLEILPWVDRPAPADVEPTPRPYPTDAGPCRPPDLAVNVGQPGG